MYGILNWAYAMLKKEGKMKKILLFVFLVCCIMLIADGIEPEGTGTENDILVDGLKGFG